MAKRSIPDAGGAMFLNGRMVIVVMARFTAHNPGHHPFSGL